MKLSISLPDDYVDFIDSQASTGALTSRSAVIQSAIRLLRDRQNVDSYAAAWDEWESSGEERLWDFASSDGVR